MLQVAAETISEGAETIAKPEDTTGGVKQDWSLSPSLL